MNNKKAKGKRKYPYYNDNVRPKSHPILKTGNEEIYNEEEKGNTNTDTFLKDKSKINSDMLEFSKLQEISIIGDGNCFYRTISQFLYGKQDYHIDIRKRLYAYAKNNKDKFKGFILSDENITSEEYIRLS